MVIKNGNKNTLAAVSLAARDSFPYLVLVPVPYLFGNIIGADNHVTAIPVPYH
jgi:hypothetical protein